VGVWADRNSRHRRTMEDMHVIVDKFAGEEHTGFFAIYDGHGGKGAVEYTAKFLHENLARTLISGEKTECESLTHAFMETDRDMKEANVSGSSGTTAVTAIIRKKEGHRFLFTGNVGDSRAVLVRDGQAIRLTYEHKGSDEEETKRIVDSGGFVLLNRVNGILAVTRSLGDQAMKEYVISEPFLSETKLEEKDTCLILACDGVWDVMTDQEAYDVISDETDPTTMSKKILVTALKKGSTDNISVMVILL